VRILLSNDDGIEAAGLQALHDAVADLGEVWIVAPATEQSAKSHSFTMHEPLRVRQHGERRLSVNGTPADAVYLAMHGLLPEKPDLVLSGVNRGSNLGTDVHYSGTVAAAREAANHDVPAVAFSLHLGLDVGQPARWATASVVARQVVTLVLREGAPEHAVLNVNIPNLELAELRGWRAAAMSHRRYETQVKEGRDLRGQPYYWIGGPHAWFAGGDDADGPLCDEGYVTLTPLALDMTDRAALERLRAWEAPA
jgi:5'-nucleotidase